MAKLIKKTEKVVWIAGRHPLNRTLVVQGFSNLMVSEDSGETFTIQETAIEMALAFILANPNYAYIKDVKTAEETIEAAKKAGI